MLRPLLIIGIGGSGGKTIRSMKQALERRLLSARYEDGIPDAWQFLQIDTTYDGVDFPAPMLPRDEVHIVVPRGATFQQVLTSMTNRATLSEQQEMLAGWGIASTAVSIAMGAGMVRGIGRQVGVADSANILEALRTSISKLQGPMALAQLGSVARALGAENPFPTPQVFIISSLAGGSGAGMFIDVAEMLKRSTQQSWGHEAISLLYTSEVFDSLGAAGANVSKNSLGAMNEMIAGKWVSTSERTELLYQKLGIAPQASVGQSGYGCKANILIGKTNKTGIDISQGADGAGMNEVFLTIGEALAGAFTSDKISEFLFQQAFVNILQTKSAVDLSGLVPENAPNPTFAAAGIGFGQLSLGADRILDYVADALTRQQVEKLLWPEMTPALLKDGANLNSLIADKTVEVWPTFLNDSGLDERGTQNQIVDALFPDEWEKNVNNFVVKLLRESLGEKETPLARFAGVIWSNWESESEEYLKSLKSEISTKAQNWVPSIQAQFKEQLANELVKSGYSVTISLVERLIEELRDHVKSELLDDHRNFAESLRTFDKSSFGSNLNTMADGLSGVTPQNREFLEKLRNLLCRVVGLQVKSYVFDLAQSLVDDMLKFFFDPLLRSLSDKRFELQDQHRASTLPDGSKNRFDQFPKWGSGIVPDRYKPRTIERILIDTDEYETTYEHYSVKDSSGNPPFPLSVNASLLGKKMNPKPGDPNKQTLIEVQSPWLTSVRDAQDQMGSAVTKLQWEFKTNLLDLAERNRKWLKDPDSFFGKFTNMSIHDFIENADLDSSLRKKREEKFVKEYSAMLGLAQPLILLNASAMNHVVGVSDGQPAVQILPKSTPIPFDANSSIGRECTQVLLSHGINVNDGSFAQTWFKNGAKDTALHAVATTQTSLPAWAFASLTDPILKQVAESKNSSGTWIQFWEGRRSRPLIEAVPFETEMRRSIVTGWFLASLFGLRRIETIATGRKVSIWNPTFQVPTWSEFPSPLLNTHLQDMKRDTWVLPSLLTSAGIALAEFGRTGMFDSIHGYQLLKFLGREVTTSIPNRDKWDANGLGDLLPTGVVSQSTYLKDWLISGKKPGENLPLLDIFEKELGKTSDRSQSMLNTIKELISQYDSAWNQFKTLPWHQLPETWELKEDIALALHDIQNYVEGVHVASAETSA